MRPVRRRELAQWIHDRFQVSTRRACALGGVCPNTWYYTSRARDASLRFARFGSSTPHVLALPRLVTAEIRPPSFHFS